MRLVQMMIGAMALTGSTPGSGPYLANGVKVGEVSQHSALVWARLTAEPTPRKGIVLKGQVATLPADVKVEDLQGAVLGAPGRVRVRFGIAEDLSDATATSWTAVTAERDFTCEFQLTDLKPATVYHYAVEAAPAAGEAVSADLRGHFETLPPSDSDADVCFTVTTCQMFCRRDDPDGFLIYDAMAALKPRFTLFTGDSVYLDNEPPVANALELARHHWHRMHSLPRLVRFYLQIPGYWEKDDHDTYCNDCWPTMKAPRMAPLTYQQGLRVFREQVPVPPRLYRTVRWGKHLEVWLVEGRDFRSPNDMPDGPDKSIWGIEQKEWLKKTLLASNATFKILVSPTPIVGPDRDKKADNHANKAFAHEGNEFRQWIKKNLPKNFMVFCGDRHWQYHAVDPTTGVQEFDCGPASDEHAGGSPGLDPSYHRFHRVKGGFLSAAVQQTDNRSRLTVRLHDVSGQVVYQSKLEQ
ncbi:MAG: alkaline phosphatase D family protein [Phycisphaerae bacterium]